jgi:glycosyltransferase involved in cell wall biosynthesis
MKLIVQIPCLNEEETLAVTVRDIPRKIDGIDQVEILIIDDGSTDRTVEVAREVGVNHIVRNTNTKGLAKSFYVGINACLGLGADIIVNTDGDNQYNGKDIPRLIKPIVDREADVVIGDRQTDKVAHFHPLKKRLQKLGSWIVRQLSETDVPDAVSGFRAFSREAALQINIVSQFTYTIETIIQAGKKHLAIRSVPIGTNTKLRESRLIKNIPQFIERSITTMIRMYTMYQPLRTFFYIGGTLILLGMIPSFRFLYFYFTTGGMGHVQSLILAAIFFIVGFQVLMIGLVADIISFNRQLIEDTLMRIRKMELKGGRDEPGDRT